MDFAYLNFTNNLPIVSNQLRKEIIIRGSCTFKNETSFNAATTSANRLMPNLGFPDGSVMKRNQLKQIDLGYYLHQKIIQRTPFFAYCLLHQIPLHSHLSLDLLVLIKGRKKINLLAMKEVQITEGHLQLGKKNGGEIYCEGI